jgi:hypothetical protein
MTMRLRLALIPLLALFALLASCDLSAPTHPMRDTSHESPATSLLAYPAHRHLTPAERVTILDLMRRTMKQASCPNPTYEIDIHHLPIPDELIFISCTGQMPQPAHSAQTYGT